METDLLVIGAGPAGISAALTADKAGANVMIVDESFMPGGQLKQQTQYFSELPSKYGKTTGILLADNLVKELQASNVKVLSNHRMVGSYLNGNIGVTDGTRTFEIVAEKCILATGAQEEGKVFPGWTLPGVMTAGAAQILMNREFVLPGKHAIIVGSNDFAFEVASELRTCGVSVEAIIEDKDHLTCERKDSLDDCDDIPIHLNSSIEMASGKGQVEHVSIRTPEGTKTFQADLICIANGFTPVLEPFQVMDCEFVYKKELGGWLPLYDLNFQTSKPNCYLAGNAAGITTLGPVLLTGEIAALSALEEIGVLDVIEARERKEKCWIELARLEKETVFQKRVEIIAQAQDRKDSESRKLFDGVARRAYKWINQQSSVDVRR